MTAPDGTLSPDELARRCDPESFDFETTAELEGEMELVGQPRASAALEFGADMDGGGYNLFALGPSGTGKRTFIQHFLQQHADRRPAPHDVCYVNDFGDPNTPTALHLKAGTARAFEADMADLLEEVGTSLPAAFEGEEHQASRHAIDESYKQRSSKRLEEIQARAKERGIAMMRSPVGFMFAPIRDGEVLDSKAFAALDEEERQELQSVIEELQEDVNKVLREAPRLERERQNEVRELDRETARKATEHLFTELRERYEGSPPVLAHLDAVQEDLIRNARSFVQSKEPGAHASSQPSAAVRPDASPLLRRYEVNVLVDNADATGAPVVFEDNPTYRNLMGSIEHRAQMGTLVTDFTLIRPGALHRANGGFLILEAVKVLQQPFAWDALKRSLRARQLRIETPGQAYSLLSAVSLEPEPIPLDLKVVLMGDRVLYYLLSAYDPEFLELFKVPADFASDMERSTGNQRAYARLIAAIAREQELRPFDRGAVARVIDRSARLAGDAERLSARTAGLADLLREASYWATSRGHDVVGAADVQHAIDAQTYRMDRVRSRLQEEMLRGNLLVDSEGSAVAQVNGLAAIELGGFTFGRPHRITASARPGKGEVIDIEREVELSGPLHAKGVLILSGFLGARFASAGPLSLSASLVFEQSYGAVDGDSASSAELYALLSAIAQVPIQQSLAVTGSVNQHGEIQPIGAVNEKIEGFFDLCAARGLTGRQGAVIPAANVKQLMLREDVIDAVRDGTFHVYPVATVAEGARLLMGMPMGEPDAEGTYPEGTLGRRVHERLAAFADAWRARRGNGDVGGEPGTAG